MKKNKIIISLSFVLIIVATFMFYCFDYYHFDRTISDYLKSSESIKVSKISNGYYFDGYGKDTALIFYPGAKVDERAYAKLMYNLAENGIDCFLIKVPFKIAFFGKGKASHILKKYKYDKWVISGHSLGGVVASNVAIKNSNKINSIILLASYPTKKISNVNLLSIYGDKDGVLNIKAYNDSKKYWPNDSYEKIIVGGNHAGFGDYGFQKRDNKSDISNDLQQSLTIDYILEFLNY